MKIWSSGCAMESVVDFACFLDGASTLDYASYGAGVSQLWTAVEPGATGSTAAPVRKRLRDDSVAHETPVSHKYNEVERRGRLPTVAVASPPPVPSALALVTPEFSRFLPGSDSREPADHEPEVEGGAAVELDASVVDAAVRSICSEFAEENAESVRLAVLALGLAASQQLQEDVRRTEAAGGLLTADGARRRSPGGVFFELLRSRVDPVTFRAIFAHATKLRNRRVNARRQRDRAYRAMSMGVAPTPGALAGFRARSDCGAGGPRSAGGGAGSGSAEEY